MNPSTFEFFDLVLNGELGELDIDNYIETLTSGFNADKLNLLLKDIEYCLFCAREEKEGEFTKVDIENAIKERKERNLEIPYTLVPLIKWESAELDLQDVKCLDLENLLFPYDFFPIYLLIKKVKHIIQNSASSKNEQKSETLPKTFEDLFFEPKNAEQCLSILRELNPPPIDSDNNYIGKAKGVFPLWVNVLKSHKPKPLIKHFKDTVYKDLLNQKVKGLNLSIDASEFRKQYKRLINNKIELDIKAILSQYSQSGKLGK